MAAPPGPPQFTSSQCDSVPQRQQTRHALTCPHWIYDQRAIKCSGFSEHQARLRHNRESQIVPIAAVVAGLETVAVGVEDGMIGEIGERAADLLTRVLLLACKEI